MSLIQSFANIVRVKSGHLPLKVVTSSSEHEIETYSPLLELFTGRDTLQTKKISAQFVATAQESIFSAPDKQRWNVQLVGLGDNSHLSIDVATGTTYNAALKELHAQEMKQAKLAGFKGNADEITAERKKAVSYNNVLHFVCK